MVDERRDGSGVQMNWSLNHITKHTTAGPHLDVELLISVEQ